MQLAPHPSLAGVVKSVWIGASAPPAGTTLREHILPTGEMHLVFRLSGPAIRIFHDPHSAAATALGHAVVGGPRSRFYIKDVAEASEAIGVQLLPGAAQALLGLPATELAGQHASLEQLWGSGAGLMREQLLASPSPADRMQLFQALLLTRLRSAPVTGIHPAVQQALALFRTGASVQEAATQSGYSHRQFIRVFSQAVGLTPKLYCRVQRFQQALGLMQRTHAPHPFALSEVALGAGYSDQPHFNREFRELAGLAPEQYRRAAVLSPNHVPLQDAPRTPSSP